MDSKDQMKRVNELIAQAMKETGLDRMFRSPSYRYYTRSGSQDRYFYTTQKINHNGKARYVAGVYRYLKTRKVLKLIKRVGFAKKYKAKDWALEMKNKEQNRRLTN